MKKTYINPELEVVKLQTMQMLAVSLLVDDDPLKVVDDVDDLLAPSLGDDFGFSEEAFSFGAEESISSFE